VVRWFSAPPACENVIKISGEFYGFGCFDFALALTTFSERLSLAKSNKRFLFYRSRAVLLFVRRMSGFYFMIIIYIYSFFFFFFLKIASRPNKRLRQRTFFFFSQLG